MSSERNEIKEKISRILNELYAVYFDLEKNNANNDNLSTENLHSNTLFTDGTFIDGANYMYNIMKKIISTKGDGYTITDLCKMFNCAFPEDIFDEFSAEAILVTVDKYFGYENKESYTPKKEEQEKKVTLIISQTPGNMIDCIYIDNVLSYKYIDPINGGPKEEDIKRFVNPGDEVTIKLSKPLYGLMLYHNELGEKTLEQIGMSIKPIDTIYYTFNVPDDAFGIAHLNIRSGYSMLTPEQRENIVKDSVIFDFINSSGWINRYLIHITTK